MNTLHGFEFVLLIFSTVLLCQSASAESRVKPKDGVIFGPGVTVDLDTQIKSKGHVKASAEGDALVVTFPLSNQEQSLVLQPATGHWHLGDATEVQVRIRNIGTTAAAPAVLLGSDGNTTRQVRGVQLLPGTEAELTIPFAAAVPWKGVPAEQRKHEWDALPGTGTQFASDKTNTIILTAQHDGEAILRVESIVARVLSPAQLPERLGKRPPVEGDWVITFDDPFDGNAIDPKKWRNTGPNWWDKISHWSKDNSIVADGTARLRYERKTGFQNDDPKLPKTDYCGGYLDTLHRFRQCYGYFEARLKVPTAPGLWPGFWLMPDRGPLIDDQSTSNGAMEFDILEHLSVWGPHRFNIAMHWDDYGPNHQMIGNGKVYVTPDKDGFVTVGLLWEPGKAVFYYNGQEVGRWEDPRVSTVPGYILLTMPVGGWDGNELDGSGLPDDLAVDYVRVWQQRKRLSSRQ